MPCYDLKSHVRCQQHTLHTHRSLSPELLAILAKSIAIAIAILGEKNHCNTHCNSFSKSVLQYYCNTFCNTILHLELVHTYNMAVSVNCIIIKRSHDVLILNAVKSKISKKAVCADAEDRCVRYGISSQHLDASRGTPNLRTSKKGGCVKI